MSIDARAAALSWPYAVRNWFRLFLPPMEQAAVANWRLLEGASTRGIGVDTTEAIDATLAGGPGLDGADAWRADNEEQVPTARAMLIAQGRC